jgi:NitT/TauT family transport system ATP-binding protein
VTSRAPGIVELRGVNRTFSDGTVAVENLTLGLRRGEFLSIVGPSGCGKSTLLRLVSGLEVPSIGSAEVLAERVGYVFQDPTLLPWRTVRRNVELLAELERVPRAERRRRAAAAIRMVGLEGFEKVRPAALSGGMRMRASLARSLVLEPDLFLFDEPFGALDEQTRERLNDELQRMFTLRGFTALFVTHSVTEAVFLGSRVAVMSGRPGRIVREVDVPFDYPRSAQLRFSPEFGRIAGEVSNTLRDGMTTRSVTGAASHSEG